MKKKFFTNPFVKYSEKSIFIFSGLFSILGIVVAYYANVRFDGLLDVHQFEKVSFWQVTQENGINISVMTILLFVFGKIINSKTRFIDILNSVLVFRIPFYIISVLIKIPFMENFGKNVAKNSNHLENLKVDPIELAAVLSIAMSFLVLLGCAVWLLFIGFKTATNCKKTSYYVVFGILIILAEVLTKIFINLL